MRLPWNGSGVNPSHLNGRRSVFSYRRSSTTEWFLRPHRAKKGGVVITRNRRWFCFPPFSPNGAVATPFTRHSSFSLALTLIFLLVGSRVLLSQTYGGVHSFLSTPTTRSAPTTIDVPWATTTVACGINGRGQIVGAFTDSSVQIYRFLDSGGTLVAMQDYTPTVYGKPTSERIVTTHVGGQPSMYAPPRDSGSASKDYGTKLRRVDVQTEKQL